MSIALLVDVNALKETVPEMLQEVYQAGTMQWRRRGCWCEECVALLLFSTGFERIRHDLLFSPLLHSP
jgi:hypothetical protein